MSDDQEIVRTPWDNRADGSVRRDIMSKNHRPKGSALWAFHETKEAGGVWGSFPRRFLDWTMRQLGDPSRVLHVCSGSLPPRGGHVRVDLRVTPDVVPDVVADGRRLPFKAGAFDSVLLDPPWSVEYAEKLYGTEYPRPSHLLGEAVRVVKPSGLFGIVHFLIPRPPAGARLHKVIGVTQGCGYRIRALTVYRKDQAGLFGEVA